MVSFGWVALAIATTATLIAGVSKKNNRLCSGINVEITEEDDHFFVDEKEVASIINANGNVQGRPLESLNLLVLEQRLENDRWIKNAELFVDNNEVLQVKIEENEPVARVFTIGGYSFYIDSSCKKLPLSDRLSARVPMFSNFPSDRARLSRVDSSYMASLKDMAVYINSYPFWKAQIAQVYINSDRELEIVPTVGGHTVLFGKPTDVDQKFDRLFSFYKQVWTKVGLEKYSTIDVRFDGQVVAAKRGSAQTTVDSTKAKQALDELLERMKNNDADAVGAVQSVGNRSVAKLDNTIAATVEVNEMAGAENASIKDIAAKANKVSTTGGQPRVVMPKQSR
jgi:cell division protein FtsQ